MADGTVCCGNILKIGFLNDQVWWLYRYCECSCQCFRYSPERECILASWRMNLGYAGVLSPDYSSHELFIPHMYIVQRMLFICLLEAGLIK